MTGDVVLAMSRMPRTVFEWALWLAVVAGCLWILWKCVEWTFRPGETEPDHVKRSILDEPVDAGGGPPRPGTPSPASPRAPEAHAPASRGKVVAGPPRSPTSPS